jgi:hypothetical protein
VTTVPDKTAPDPELTGDIVLGKPVASLPNALPPSATISADACSGRALLENPVT